MKKTVEETFESVMRDIKEGTILMIVTKKLKQLHYKEINDMIKEFTKTPIKTKEVLIINGELQNKIKELQAELQELKIRHHCK